MIRRYVFAAQPHHELHVGAAVYHGGEELELDDALATDPRLVPVAALRDEDYPDVVETVEESDRSETTLVDSVSEQEFEGRLEHDGLAEADDRDDEEREFGMPRPQA